MRRLVLLAIAACGLPDFTIADAGPDTGSDADVCPSGALDTRFGDAGRVVYRSSTTGPDDWFVHAVAARGPNGVVTMSMVDLPDGGLQTSLIALDSNGAFDTSFADAGHALFASPELPLPYGLASDALGRVYIGGPSAQAPYVVARLDVAGNLDATFGTNGVASYAAPDGQALRLAVDDQGRAVLAGSTSTGLIRVVRFTNAGALDSTFGASGQQTYSYVLSDAGTTAVTALTVDAESPIICGKVTPSGAVYCARLLPSGTPDNNFGNGSAITYPQGPPSWVDSLALDRTTQPPTILAIGWGGLAAAPTSWAVRYSSTGAVLTTFESIAGFAGVVLKGGIVEPDGKIFLVGGATPDGLHYEWIVARYEPFGPLDQSFGTSGVTRLQFYGNEYANSAVIDPSGEIVVVGAATDAGFGDPASASAAARFCR